MRWVYCCDALLFKQSTALSAKSGITDRAQRRHGHSKGGGQRSEGGASCGALVSPRADSGDDSEALLRGEYHGKSPLSWKAKNGQNWR